MSRTIMLVRTKWMRIFKWIVEFLIICGSGRVLQGSVFVIYSFYPTSTMEGLLFWFYIGVPVALIFIGIANLLHIADIRYMRQGALNPAIARDSYQDSSRGRNQKGQIGILFGLSGLALFFGFAPSTLFYPLHLSSSEIVAFSGDIVLLLLFVMLYMKMLRKNIELTTEETTE